MFSPHLFNKFCDYYISGFINIVKLIEGPGTRHIFYPSTVFIDELLKNMG